jgi:hypothetical protein
LEVVFESAGGVVEDTLHTSLGVVEVQRRQRYDALPRCGREFSHPLLLPGSVAMLPCHVGAGCQQRGNEDNGKACGEGAQFGPATPTSIPCRPVGGGVGDDLGRKISRGLRDGVVRTVFGPDAFSPDIRLLGFGLGVFNRALRAVFSLCYVRFGGVDQLRLPAQLNGPSAGTGSSCQSFGLCGFGLRLLSHRSHLSRGAWRPSLVQLTWFLVSSVLTDRHSPLTRYARDATVRVEVRSACGLLNV